MAIQARQNSRPPSLAVQQKKTLSLHLTMKKLLVLGAVALTLIAPAAGAQRNSRNGSGGIELGIDAGLTFGVGNSSGTLFSLPTQVFRLGYFLSDKLEFEPRFSINSISGGGNTVSTYNLEAGLLLIPDGDRVGKGLYLRPFAGVTGISVSGGNSANSGDVGVGVGLKLPFADRRLATRLEANYDHGFSGGGSNTIGLLAGLSFFTR
jgi:hypothetical protein